MAINVFDQLSVGIVLLDRSARVMFANAAARSLSADGGPVRVNASVTTSASPDARRLDELIRSALSSSSVRTMSLPSARSGRPLMVLVAPVRPVDRDRPEVPGLCEAAAVVMLCDPDRPADIPAAWIMDAYGLTLAEVRVAIAAASGTTISEMARRLRISPNTVKTHLRRVFGKTGTSRQAELSRLLATIGLARCSGLDA